MPYKLDRAPLESPFLDRRVKLLPCQRERCYAMHHQDGVPMRALARMFGVDRRLISFVCYPEQRERNLQTREALGGSAKYYDTAKNTKAMRKHRQHKYELHKYPSMKRPKNIRIYDDGGATADRYTVIYMDEPERDPGTYNALCMSADPFSPLGICQHSSAMPGRHLGKRIRWEDLPEDCRKAVVQDCEQPNNA